jgi:excisionase family DNA binding protein
MVGERQFFRPSEIAPQLGVTTGRVYQMIASGEIPATRVGGSIRIPRRAWKAWLAEKSAPAPRVAHEEGF